jgi:hypothetical protein
MRAILLLLMAALMIPAAFAASCTLNTGASTLQEFMADIPNINAGLASCPVDLPPVVRTLYANADFTVNVGSSFFVATAAGGKITSISKGIQVTKYTVTISEADFNTMFNNAIPAFTWLYANKRIKIKANNFWSGVRLGFTRPFLSMATWFQPKPTKGGPGDICQHGGECESTFCLGIPNNDLSGQSQGGRVYKCSCEQSRFNFNC